MSDLKKYAHIDFKPPQSVADAAERGLKARREQPDSKKAGLSRQQAAEMGIGSGVQRAINLKNRDNIPPETIKRMVSFFARHRKNKDSERGKVAWDLWGGEPGRVWAERIAKQMKKADETNEGLKVKKLQLEMYEQPKHIVNEVSEEDYKRSIAHWEDKGQVDALKLMTEAIGRPQAIGMHGAQWASVAGFKSIELFSVAQDIKGTVPFKARLVAVKEPVYLSDHDLAFLLRSSDAFLVGRSNQYDYYVRAMAPDLTTAANFLDMASNVYRYGRDEVASLSSQVETAKPQHKPMSFTKEMKRVMQDKPTPEFMIVPEKYKGKI